MHITCMSAISGTQNLLSWHKREPYRTYWQHSDQLNPLIVNRRIGMRLCRILGPNKYPPRPLCVALNQSTNLAYLCTPVQSPPCKDIRQSWTCQRNMLSYLYHCDKLNLELHVQIFTSFYEKNSTLFHDNLLGITEVLAALCVKDEEKSFLGWSVVWRGRRKASSLSPWRSDELGMEENTASRHCSQQHFFSMFSRKK